ncbi:hypothetical protein VVD49_18540 [Uliginosibacterium sp. H3]|uniref:Uncharacterized protein n=1 Tax=Uliginosibacterium silvisoli TaxID=3114758 RepID=A0ABU6K792_9RHOO|nr:hypothetical protein [Uliginosibacterium sp. H3]
MTIPKNHYALSPMGSSIHLIADYFRVSHVPAASIPCSRLSDILTCMHQGQPLTKGALDFLRRQNMPGLYQLACGEISHEAYIAGLDSAHIEMHRVAQAAHQIREAERQALANGYPTSKTTQPDRNTAPEMDAEARRKLRHQREREETEAVLNAQRARQAACKVQRERNQELAAAAYLDRMARPDAVELSASDIARYFHLTHINAAVCPPLSGILEALFRGRQLTEDELAHLRLKAPEDLHRLAYGQLLLNEYLKAARATEAEAVACKARAEDAEIARIARESDPEYIAMMALQALYKKYDVSLTDAFTPQMTTLLQHINAGKRLSKEQLAWLGTEARDHFSQKLRETYHALEAESHADAFRRTQDPRSAINASGHYRKANQSASALGLLDRVTPSRLKDAKTRSAFLTTRGGAMRDLERRAEAILLAEEAHALMPSNYRPCTLLGAVYMEQRDFALGHEWYAKARQLGAPEQGIDSELRSIFRQLDSAGREAMKRYLLGEDAQRYGWLRSP